MQAGNALQQMLGSHFMCEDPGSGGTIHMTRHMGVTPVNTTPGGSRTFAQPTKEGLIHTVVLCVDGGDLTLTVTGGYNADGDTSVTLGDAGDFVTFISIKVGASYYWRVLAQEGTNIAVENIAVDQLTVTTLTIGSTAVTADAAEINQLDGTILSDMTEGSGITGAVGGTCEHSVEKIGGLFKTTILIDLTGLNSGGTDGDIIGKNGGTANCHIGQITAARNGTIFAGEMQCLEAPAGGSNDIDLYSATESTGAEDAAISGLAETQLVNAGGAWTAALIKVLAAFPAANEYLYLTGNTGDATYTAGILKITLWGK